MQDVYAWVDPFEEIERARQWGAWQRQEGSRDALKFIADNNTGEFNKALGRAVDQVARKIAREFMEPMIRENYKPYIDYRAREEEFGSQLLSIADPLIDGVIAGGALELRMVDRLEREPHLMVSYELAQPFRYNLAMMPDWRYARRRA